ncbi:MAG: hypothetical protein COA90_00895 [Gammaproteobacteria bacterium]|nr:MAG: hypothetical protein COA90_00895 [Gammaproteobacteria bacterium]
MQGISNKNYQPINAKLHIQQSVLDIITTPIGTRVLRRDYGSIIPDLLDEAQTPTTAMRVIAGVAHAVHQWEPRINSIKSVKFQGQSDGQQHITIATDQGTLLLDLTASGVANVQ